MTREEVNQEVLSIKAKNLLLEIPTGFGKSRLAIEILDNRVNSNILIVVPRNVLIDTWKAEFSKWGMEKYLPHITFSTYVSLEKHAGSWDMVIFDECHHITERCKEVLQSYTIKNALLLSATVKPKVKWLLKSIFISLYIYKVSTRDAIESDVLPDPRVILMPLQLDDSHLTEEITNKRFNRTYKCTQKKYYNDLSNLIDWYKRRAMGSQVMKNLWLHKCGERLKWLSDKKSNIVLTILKNLSNYRTLTFCNSIAQTEVLGKNHIHSKNKESQEILESFNKGKIKHITSVAMLDEGVNLKNCQIGIYANLNSSERIVKQRLGRILRHKNPVIIIPFYLNTREEEIVKQMLLDYNPALISVVYKIADIKI